MITLESALAALEIASKRIDELEKYNLDLASESFNKSNMIDYERVKNAELAAQVEAMKNGIHHFNRTHGDLNPLLKAAFNSTPAQCLLEVKADAGRDGFIACLDYLGECDIEIGEHFEQDINAADRYANKIREGE